MKITKLGFVLGMVLILSVVASACQPAAAPVVEEAPAEEAPAAEAPATVAPTAEPVAEPLCIRPRHQNFEQPLLGINA